MVYIAVLFSQGFPLTYLRVPVNLIADGFNEADFTARGKADGSQDCNGSKLYHVIKVLSTLSLIRIYSRVALI